MMKKVQSLASLLVKKTIEEYLRESRKLAFFHLAITILACTKLYRLNFLFLVLIIHFSY